MTLIILTIVAAPYFSMSNQEASEFVLKGGRLERPEECPEDLWKLIITCWKTEASGRPTFKQIFEGIIIMQYFNEISMNIFQKCKISLAVMLHRNFRKKSKKVFILATIMTAQIVGYIHP